MSIINKTLVYLSPPPPKKKKKFNKKKKKRKQKRKVSLFVIIIKYSVGNSTEDFGDIDNSKLLAINGGSCLSM